MLRSRGIFSLGNYHTDELALLHTISQGNNPTNTSKSDKIVVYGEGIRVLCLIGRLEEFGIDLERVIWVTSNDTIPDTNCTEVKYNSFFFLTKIIIYFLD